MAANADTSRIDLFEFAVLRDPKEVSSQALTRHFIADDVLAMQGGTTIRVASDLQSSDSPSFPGRTVFEWVFCGPENCDDDIVALTQILLDSLPRYAPKCWAREDGDPTETLPLQDLERHGYIYDRDRWWILPDSLDRLDQVPLVRQLQHTQPLLQQAQQSLDLKTLHKRMREIFDVSLYQAVFHNGSYSDGFLGLKRGLFDALYLLYVLRQRVNVQLVPIMDGLRAVHTLEALAIDQALDVAMGANPVPAHVEVLVSGLSGVFPSLSNWHRHDLPDGFPLIADEDDLRELMAATPIVHPIFGQLCHYRRPFNDIQPVGIADLKVVKQWLVAYEPGEISDVNNIMKGEARHRRHRRFEKSEDVFSYSSERTEEATKDNQTTDRFEVKRETDHVLKTDLTINANLTLQYNGSPIVATATGGFAYTRGQSDQEKASQNFWREVVSKAVSRVQDRATEQRTATRIFEHEERNLHSFDNVKGGKHVSGVYRWVDKRYRAQLFNFGKRLMFEFIIPEPAAFLVEARLQAYAGSLDLPPKPKDPDIEQVVMEYEPDEITESVFNDWREIYDLEAFTYPVMERKVSLVGQRLGSARFQEKDIPKMGDDQILMYLVSEPCRGAEKGYEITQLYLYGDLHFHSINSGKARDANQLWAGIDGTVESVIDDDTSLYIGLSHFVNLSTPYLITGDTVELMLWLRDIKHYVIGVIATLKFAKLHDWQMNVFNTVRHQKQKVVDAKNREAQLGYDTAMVEYRNRLAQVQATVVNDLLRGQSDALNQETIRTELKRQCLAMLTKEFDADDSNDILTDLAAMGTRMVSDAVYPHVAIDEKTSPPTAEYERTKRDLEYPAVDLINARKKGLTIQFLEESFEWHQLAYVFYASFWAPPPKWVEMMDRSDDTDPNLTAFLRAGAARVLLAVAPDHDDAVHHYLCTRKPWFGNRNAPVIGNKLHIPLYEEIRRAQDDRLGAKPEGEAWEFTVPTSLVYLENSTTPLPDLPKEKPAKP